MINARELTQWKIWLAQYNTAPTYTTTKYDLWQYSSTGKVSGINGNVDMNLSYLGY
jgi:GH25 family lysozyme M1 (1,4-beta-N-acetylmuramidase)